LTVVRQSFEEAALRSYAADLVAAAVKKGEVEAVGELCSPVPLRAVSSALGMSEGATSTIVESGKRILDAGQRGVPLRTLAGLEAEARTIEVLIEECLRSCGSQAASGLSLMIRLNSEQFGFSERELVGLVFFLVWAAVDTTNALLANALYLFATHPEQRALIRADPSLLPVAIEEVLRTAGSVKRTNGRVVRESFRLAGINFPPGSVLIADLAAAQRDAQVYVDPEAFEVQRRSRPNVAFGLGVHTCLGASIARAEAQVLLAEAIQAADFWLADRQPEWQVHPVFRRLEHLHLVFSPCTPSF
jgi:cytochrome P450